MNTLRIVLVLSFLFSMGAFPSSTQAAIPAGVEITSATLSIFVASPTFQQGSVYRVTSDWNETAVTWNSFEEAYDPEVLNRFPLSAGWKNINVTTLVQGWVDGSLPNYGVLIKQDVPPTGGDILTAFPSSEAADVELRPSLRICYMVPGSAEQCETIQRSGAAAEDVFDTTIESQVPNANFGALDVLYLRNAGGSEKQNLLRFAIDIQNLRPGVELVKYTNGVIANDPNGSDVPQLRPGDAVEWTYRVTNTGETAVPREQVVVTDNQPGVTPAFYAEVTGDGDTVLEPGEVWDYQALGEAATLVNPPEGMIIVPNACTLLGARPGLNAYVNQGAVTIPGAEDTAESSYCNPPEAFYSPYQYWVPISFAQRSVPELEDYQVSVGYEDLPLLFSRNDYDYNDWVMEITFLVRRLPQDPDMIDQIIFDFTPGARGSIYRHAFFLNLPAGTFPTGGTTALTTFDANGRQVRVTNGTFNGARASSFQIFANTQDIYPVNQTNTYEDSPLVNPKFTATLTINFAEPVNFSDIPFSLAQPHGEGLFFEPQIRVLNTGNVIGKGDQRMLTVPQFQWSEGTLYAWPEEYARIDKVYPRVTFTAGNPPVLRFPDGWWREHNNCAYDGQVCTAIP